MFARHLSSHPSIQDHNGTFRTAETIYQESLRDLFLMEQIQGLFSAFGLSVGRLVPTQNVETVGAVFHSRSDPYSKNTDDITVALEVA